MTEIENLLRDFINRVKSFTANSCFLSHDIGGNFQGDEKISIGLNESDSSVLNLGFSVKAIPLDWYAEIPKVLFEIGVKRIELFSWCEFIGNSDEYLKIFPGHGPDCNAVLQIRDHIACHLPNPLTGTTEAQKGKAFVNMRGAYENEFRTPFLRGLKNDSNIRLAEGVIWHSRNDRDLSAEEIDYLRNEGFLFASPNIAMWAVGARASGCEFAAAARVRYTGQ